MTRPQNQRNVKKDVYVNDDSSSWSDDSSDKKRKMHRSKCCKKEKKCERKYETKCETLCHRLDLTPPKNACEKKTVTHCFQVSLGKCEVTKDVKITHCITANLKHHIEENVVCHHEPCTKYTQKKVHVVEDGKCCKVKFPECDNKIVYTKGHNSCDDPCPKPVIKCHTPSPHCPPKPCPKPCDSSSDDHKSHHKSYDSSDADSLIPSRGHKNCNKKNNFW